MNQYEEQNAITRKGSNDCCNLQIRFTQRNKSVQTEVHGPPPFFFCVKFPIKTNKLKFLGKKYGFLTQILKP